MKVTFFIDRPVFSAVISIVIVIVGIIGLTMLPVDQYPQITPPVVKISASYPPLCVKSYLGKCMVRKTCFSFAIAGIVPCITEISRHRWQTKR